MAANEQKLKLLESQRELFFQRLQTIYDYSCCDLKDPEALDNFLCSIESLEDVRTNFQSTAKEYNITLLKIDKESVPDSQSWLSFEDMYCRIKRKLSMFTPPKAEFKPTPAKSLIRLAPIEMPEFNGDRLQWPLFYATFHNAVHLNASLTNTERMYYLVGRLSGKAKSICTGIVPCAENYNAIYSALISKYEDKRSLAVTYLDQMFSLKPIASATASNLESFIDQFANAYLALNNLNIPDLCDFVMSYTLLQKLDKESARLFEMENRGVELPNLNGLISFVRDRVKVLTRTGDQSGSKTQNTIASKTNVRSFIVNNNTANKCSLCEQPDHSNLYLCSTFRKLSPRERFKFIKSCNACINCLSKTHTAQSCKSINTCKQCQQKHHSMLHFLESDYANPHSLSSKLDTNTSRCSEGANGRENSRNSTSSKSDDRTLSLCSMNTYSHASHGRKSQNVLLGTALADVKSNDGSVRKVRFLIDNGSQNHFITKQACKQLGLRVFNDSSNQSVMGIGDTSQPISGITDLTLYSRLDPNFCLKIQPLVIKTISGDLPSCSLNTSAVTHLYDLPLADPHFYAPGPIDVLLGSEVFVEILRPGKSLGPAGQPDALETAFGYIVMGSTASVPADNHKPAHNQTHRAFFTSSDESIEALVTKFWQLESVPTQKHMSTADQECEHFYVSNTHRDVNSGRYVTALPFSKSPHLLGDSLTTATRRYSYLDHKFQTNKTLKSEYDKVMTDYLKGGIVSPAPALNTDNKYYVIPHHGVCRPEKPLRLVCDPSAKSSTQVALNDILHSGPNLQADLTAIILKFRLSPAQLLSHPLWLHGPPWARDDLRTWPINRFTFDSTADEKLLEIKKRANVFITTDEQPQFLCTLAKKVSSWSKLFRIIVYLYRFLGKIPRSNRIELSHLQYAENIIVKSLQQQYFKDDINALSNNRKVSKSLIPLSPFLKNDLRRIGGRLEKSSLCFDAKHPILLPKKDHIVNILIDYYHRKYLHAGPHLLLSLLRQKFWIISGRTTVKQRFRLCNKCFKVNPRNEAPFMAPLPASRVTEAKPFLRTGVDYAGPINILISRYRGARKEKAYICLFTCLVTRAVHLELAVDLSTDSFFRAFRRFISRRSNCLELFSDNGGNFLGAKAQLDELNGFLKSKAFCDSFAEETISQGISWHLNPPSAPHFGGIWETNVRSVKLILKRVIGDVLLTYEELLTVLTQVESLLNSRPLTAVLSSDPAEPKALCPSDFLTMGPLESFHDDSRYKPTLTDLVRSKHLTDQVVQRYWNRWRQEYLNTLQTRAKWNTKSNPVTKGAVVVLKTENSPPLQWPLGIVEDIHPSSDGIVRVVTVRTKNGTYVRPVVKLCVLPSQ